MAPAALHRISFGGEDSADFIRIGSIFVITAPLPLALGIALDTYVATARALESNLAAASIAGTTVIVLTLLWYAYPVWRRINPGTSQSPLSEAFNIMLTDDLASAAVRILDVAKIKKSHDCRRRILHRRHALDHSFRSARRRGTSARRVRDLHQREQDQGPWRFGTPTGKGAVCPDVAIAMAEEALKRSPADLAVAVTGVAGPELIRMADKN